MYNELARRLRAAKAVVFKNEDVTLLCEAADAIEDLENKLNLWRQNKISRWIPVTEQLPEQLPEEGVSVQVCFHSQGGIAQAVSERFVNDRNQSYWSGLCGMKPTHWMPLPPPPEPVGNSEQLPSVPFDEVWDKLKEENPDFYQAAEDMAKQINAEESET